MKDIHVKATVTALASFDVGHLKESLKINNSALQPFSGSKFRDRLLGKYLWVEKCLKRIAKCLESLRTLVQGSSEGFCMFTYNGRVRAIESYDSLI